MPTIWIVALFLGAVFLKSAKWKKRCLLGGLIALLLFTNSALVNFIFQQYESRPVPLQSMATCDMGIILTGVANTEMEPNDRTYYNKGADRVLHAAQLFKEKKIKRILITGGEARLVTKARSEAEDLKRTLLLHEIPDSCIYIENKAFNTRENAVFSKALLDSIHYQGPVVLITSAYHMPRAKACFDKVGLTSIIFPTDYYQNTFKWTPDFWLVPSEKALLGWNLLMREWIGYSMYWVVGYI